MINYDIFLILGFTPFLLPLWVLAISAANHCALFLWVNSLTVFRGCLPFFFLPLLIVTAQFFPIFILGAMKDIKLVKSIKTKQLRTVTGSSKPYIIIGSSSKHGNPEQNTENLILELYV